MKHFNYDFQNNAIVGSKKSIERANKGLNPEYSILTAMLDAHPTFKIQVKTINHKKVRKYYHGLNIDRMKEYIATQPDAENNLKLFEAVVKVADAKGAKYPLTKKWFFAKFPEYKENNVKDEELSLEETAAAELAALENDDNDTEETEEREAA